MLRNMSAPARHQATVTPVEIVPSCGVVADLTSFFERDRDPWRSLLEAVGGKTRRGHEREALRALVEKETDARSLTGGAIVELARASVSVPTIEKPILALILLSKSSNVVWVAGKTPILDEATLARRIFTRDVRFVGGKR